MFGRRFSYDTRFKNRKLHEMLKKTATELLRVILMWNVYFCNFFYCFHAVLKIFNRIVEKKSQNHETFIHEISLFGSKMKTSLKYNYTIKRYNSTNRLAILTIGVQRRRNKQYFFSILSNNVYDKFPEDTCNGMEQIKKTEDFKIGWQY